MKNSLDEDRNPVYSRKAKATTVFLDNPVDEFLRNPTLSPVRRKHPVKRSHSSLPASLTYSFGEDVFISDLSSCSVQEEDGEQLPLSPMSRIAAFRKELDLLKGCVSETNIPFSPSSSPDISLLETFNAPMVSRPPPLPVDEPFKILSSSSHIVLPLEEYSIQVPILDSESSALQIDVLKKIDSEFSKSDLDIFSDSTFCESTSLEPNQSSDTLCSQSPTSSRSRSPKPISRQGSLEYDHLEEKDLEKGNVPIASANGNDAASSNNNYSVTVQFHEPTSAASTNTTDTATKCQEEAIDMSSYMVCLQDIEACMCSGSRTSSGGMQGTKSLLTLNTTKQVEHSSLVNGTLSIPERLNSLHLKNYCNAPQTVVPTEFVSTNDETMYGDTCHCPVCCACKSSQRPITADLGGSMSGGCGRERKMSSVSQQHYTDETLSNATWPTCPLERYNTTSSANSSSLLSKRKGGNGLTPAVSVLQGISKRIDRVPSGKDNAFGSSVEISHSNSVIEDELEISSNYGNQVYRELDNQSMYSVMSCQSCLTSHSYCSSNQPFIKGVEGPVFKERIEMISQWFTEFNDQQRNTMLQRLISLSNCSQMHMLSVEMEPILHQGCPHNCQDLLSWLPSNIGLRIMSFLDPVSLCRSSQVSKLWYTMANDPLLWKRLTLSRNWQMSFGGHTKQLDVFTSGEGEVQWKLMFAERFRLRRNWLKGYCTVRTFEGHSQGISCVQFDDTRIVSGSWDKTIKVWNRRTNTAWAALTLAGHSGTVRCLHLHGNRLVSGSSDRTIKVWDLATNNVNWVGAACKATMVGHLHTVRCLQADDTKVVSGSYDHTLKIWDIKTGTCTKTLRGHKDAVLCLQFDNEKVISGSKDTTIKVWEFKNGQCKHTLYGHEGAVSCLQFDDNRIISGALDRLIKIWNLSTGQCVRTIDWIKSEGHTGVVRHLQADSWKMVSAADDKTLKVWSLQSGERLLTLRSHSDGVTCLQFNDQVIVSGSYDKTVKLWDFSVC